MVAIWQSVDILLGAVSQAFSVELNKVANCAIWSVSLYDQLELMFGTLLGQVE